MLETSLESALPLGLIATRKSLLAQGMSAHKLDNALKSGKLIALAPAVYARSGLPVAWQGLVVSLQRLYPKGALGGLTALELQGLGHFASLASERSVHFYAPAKEPTWLKKLNVGGNVVWHKSDGLWLPAFADIQNRFNDVPWRDDLEALKISCPEKALLELLEGVPATVSFDYADALMQGLTSLSPAKLEWLLHACTSVKVKRLFFWLAFRYQYSWLKKIDPAKFDLGSGKRAIAQNGKLDKQFQITVPEHLYGQQ
jgi:hypothetical protein